MDETVEQLNRQIEAIEPLSNCGVVRLDSGSATVTRALRANLRPGGHEPKCGETALDLSSRFLFFDKLLPGFLAQDKP